MNQRGTRLLLINNLGGGDLACTVIDEEFTAKIFDLRDDENLSEEQYKKAIADLFYDSLNETDINQQHILSEFFLQSPVTEILDGRQSVTKGEPGSNPFQVDCVLYIHDV